LEPRIETAVAREPKLLYMKSRTPSTRGSHAWWSTRTAASEGEIETVRRYALIRSNRLSSSEGCESVDLTRRLAYMNEGEAHPKLPYGTRVWSAIASMTVWYAVALAGIASAVGTGVHVNTHPCYDMFGATQSGFAACASLKIITIADFAGLFVVTLVALQGVRSVGRRWRSTRA